MMPQYIQEEEIARSAERLIRVQTVELPSASAVLSYYLTVNTIRSASALSVSVYGIAVRQYRPVGDNAVQACALCISADREKVENLLDFMIQHTVFPMHLKDVLENMEDSFTVPPLILTEDERAVLKQAKYR